MSKRISHSLLDPVIGPILKSVYPRLHIPAGFPPEGIVLAGHVSAIIGAVGFAFSTQFWWGGVLAAGGVIGNHLADCIDGTHARQTGQCRNGGELLDHFTDPLSFAYWLIGIGVAIDRLDLAIAAVVCLFATAVLTNIKAKLMGEFTLAKFGPTEFKTLLVLFAVAVSVIGYFENSAGTATYFATAFYMGLLAVGIIQLAVNLVLAIRDVNRSDIKPDASEWVITRSTPDDVRERSADSRDVLSVNDGSAA